MMGKQEVLRWLETLSDDCLIGIDDGGLCLVTDGTEADEGAYLEIGGFGDDEFEEEVP